VDRTSRWPNAPRAQLRTAGPTCQSRCGGPKSARRSCSGVLERQSAERIFSVEGVGKFRPLSLLRRTRVERGEAITGRRARTVNAGRLQR